MGDCGHPSATLPKRGPSITAGVTVVTIQGIATGVTVVTIQWIAAGVTAVTILGIAAR